MQNRTTNVFIFIYCCIEKKLNKLIERINKKSNKQTHFNCREY